VIFAVPANDMDVSFANAVRNVNLMFSTDSVGVLTISCPQLRLNSCAFSDQDWGVGVVMFHSRICSF